MTCVAFDFKPLPPVLQTNKTLPFFSFFFFKERIIRLIQTSGAKHEVKLLRVDSVSACASFETASNDGLQMMCLETGYQQQKTLNYPCSFVITYL